MSNSMPIPEDFVEEIEGRRRFRELAEDVAELTNRDRQEVLRLLLETQAKQDYPNDSSMRTGRVEFQMSVHHADVLREARWDVLQILGGHVTDDGSWVIPLTPEQRTRFNAAFAERKSELTRKKL